MPTRRAARATAALAALLLRGMVGVAFAQGGQPPATPTFEESIVVTTPLPGAEQAVSHVPAAVQTVTAKEIAESGALELGDFLNRRLTGVHLNEVQGNPFQPDVSYRGYTASPLLGTPQGLSIYFDGVRMNQPFGEIVSWDLIPRLAISAATLVGGSSPTFGLNTLGGAIALQSKTGLSTPGTTVELTYGSQRRRMLEFEHGGARRNGLHWYAAGTLFGEDGWRQHSPSDVRQLLGKAGLERPRGSVALLVSHANNALRGNGLQDFRLLDQDYTSVYTLPDINDNRATLVNLTARRELRPRLTTQGNVYFRDIRSATVNGDINEGSLDQPVYQPGAAERAALAAAGYGAVAASGLDATNTPFPFLRCVANVLLGDEPGEKCNGLLNRSASTQRVAGASGQLVHRVPGRHGEHVLVAGGGLEHSTVAFQQSTELGYLLPDRRVRGLGVFADGVTGGSVDGEPFDTAVDLTGTATTGSLFVAATEPLSTRVTLTASARYNHAAVHNRDQRLPGGGPGSLDGDHLFQRLNPSVGATVDAGRGTTLYASYSEGSRAATAIELGCADPANPCRLPNAMAGDPPLRQVVTGTLEGGVRATRGPLSWSAGYFVATNRDDILFVTSEQTGFGYFRNVDRTRRQGVETSLRARLARVTLGGGYTWLDATFRSEATVTGGSNSASDAAAPGLEGAITVEPGNRLPFTPRHTARAWADADLSRRLSLDLNVVMASGTLARGNENNAHEPDGVYYLGAGSTDPYAVVNVGARHAVGTHWQIVAQLNNVLDTHYATAAQLGPAGITPAGTFIARPFAGVNGAFPLRHTTFLAPGAPRRGWVGIRVRF